MSKKPYTPSQITEIGSFHDLTLAFNKVGPNSDQFSTINNGIVGSVVPR